MFSSTIHLTHHLVFISSAYRANFNFIKVRATNLGHLRSFPAEVEPEKMIPNRYFFASFGSERRRRSELFVWAPTVAISKQRLNLWQPSARHSTRLGFDGDTLFASWNEPCSQGYPKRNISARYNPLNTRAENGVCVCVCVQIAIRPRACAESEESSVWFDKKVVHTLSSWNLESQLSITWSFQIATQVVVLTYDFPHPRLETHATLREYRCSMRCSTELLTLFGSGMWTGRTLRQI